MCTQSGITAAGSVGQLQGMPYPRALCVPVSASLPSQKFLWFTLFQHLRHLGMGALFCVVFHLEMSLTPDFAWIYSHGAGSQMVLIHVMEIPV